MSITLEQAKFMVENRTNGAFTGISPDKGGRVWLDGEWRLSELEALCIVIRDVVGPDAEGAEELQKIWDQMDSEEKSPEAMS